MTKLTQIQNPKTSRFIEIARSFKAEWGDELTAFVDAQGRREAIDSIMGNRHLIAHGKSSTITMASLNDYFTRSLEVITFIEKQCAMPVAYGEPVA